MAVTVIMFIDGWNGNRVRTTNVVSLLLSIYNLDFLRVCVYFIWQNPFRLQIVVKSIKNRHFWILLRIVQESVKYLFLRVNSFASFICLTSHRLSWMPPSVVNSNSTRSRLYEAGGIKLTTTLVQFNCIARSPVTTAGFTVTTR